MMPNRSPPKRLPRTLAEAMDKVFQELGPEERAKLALVADTALPELNSGLGARVRKICGLWQGNPALMDDCGTLNPEDTSLVILQALWSRLRGT